MADDNGLEVLGADLAAQISLSLTVEWLATAGEPELRVALYNVGSTIREVIEDYVADGFITSARDEALVLAHAAAVLEKSRDVWSR